MKRNADVLEADLEIVQDFFGKESLATPESQRGLPPNAQPREEPAVVLALFGPGVPGCLLAI